MLKLKIIFFLILFSGQLIGQSYVEYQKTFNRIDEDIKTGNNKLAIERLDSINSKYDFVYSRHCMKALQICVCANDSVRTDQWLVKCFKQGIPDWIIRNNEITKQSLLFSTTKTTFKNFDSLISIYNSKINLEVCRSIDSLIAVDQKYTRLINDGFVLCKPIYWLRWARNNKTQYNLLKKIIQQSGYPEEKIIGISFIHDSMLFAKHLNFWGPSIIRDSRVQIMLQHYYSTSRKIDLEFKNILHENVINGNLPASQFAIIIEFMFPEKKK